MTALDICDPEHPDHETARASLVRKIDWHVLPGKCPNTPGCLSSGWLASLIGRTSAMPRLGGHRSIYVGGMETSLGLHGDQYNVGLAVL
ncbi:uncharacterized protein VP01_2556g3 [Puccinia sorghi]|uniref:Uncharacterized protein n=1 Tax=Puccinia sorghi TaxID=27349 RepID=A0A0L6V6Z7_9BASI|nr:uncharacterized protein VP01_2556g3 [Puccinia sorghi]